MSDVTNKQAVIKEYAKSANDTGSAEVQIALLTDRINHLTQHLKDHPQDHHGLQKVKLHILQ